MKQKQDKILRRLVLETRPIWKWLALACLLCIGLISCAVIGPKLLGQAIDQLYAYWEGSFAGDLLATLLPMLLTLLGVYAAYSLFSYFKMLLLNKVVSRYFTCNLRIRISDKIQRLPVSYVDQTSVGDVLSRMTGDVSTMGNYVHQIIDTLMTGFLMILAIAVMMFLEDWRLGLIVIALTPLSILLSSFISSKSEKHFYQMFTQSGELNSLVEESFTNFATTKAYNLEQYTEQKHAVLNDRRRVSEATANFTSSIVGPTGAGKTTIVNLLMRFYDVDRGRILIDGVDCATLSREEMRDQFAMVLQDTWLFRGTIAENVAYGKPDATREEIVSACDRAYCDHFIRTLPAGYDTVVGDDMTNLSGGQKQLLTIARAMLANRRLLILDEATSNVDTRTEALLQKAMDRLMRDRTCFVIAHRLSTIVDSDLILVLDHGQIVEQGTHTELLAKKGFYYQIYNSQYAI